MRCDTCQGDGRILNPALKVTVDHRKSVTTVHNPDGLSLMVPCPDCGGCGIVSCCDGAVGSLGGTNAEDGGG